MHGNEQSETLYIQAIENLFLAIRKQGLMLSPVDRKCAGEWFRAGVPLSLACQSILDECTRFRENKPGWAPLPMRLTYFSQPIHKAFQASLALEVPQEMETPPSESDPLMSGEDPVFRTAMDQLEAHGKAASHRALRKAYRSLYKRLRSWGKARHTSGVAWAGIWNELDQLLVQEVLENLSESERAPLENEVDSQFREQRRGLGNKARSELRTMLLAKAVRNHFSLLCLAELQTGDTNQ